MLYEVITYTKRRYADAVAAYKAFVSRNRFHRKAPQFDMQVIEINIAGGLDEGGGLDDSGHCARFPLRRSSRSLLKVPDIRRDPSECGVP